MAQRLEGGPALAVRLLGKASAAQAKRALAVLSQVTRNHPSTEHTLRRALSEHLAARWEIVVEVAQETGDPLGRLVADVLEQAPDPELASEIERSLPERTVALRELAVVATRQALQQGRQEALAAIEEATALCRRLAERRPDTFLPDLAMSLNNQSAQLSGLGRREEALAAIEEAVGLRRRLAERRPDAFLPDLAMSLNNQSDSLNGLGRREEALAAVEEAVALYRGLAERRPDAFLPDLAMSLNTRSDSLSGLGRRQEALAAVEEAVDLILPTLERSPFVLPDSGLGLVQSYVKFCEAVERGPDEAILDRMHTVLVSAGVLAPGQDDGEEP